MFKQNIFNILQGDKQTLDIVFANLIVFSACFLSFFIPFLSFSLPIILFFYFEVGLAGFVLNSEMGISCKYENLFVNLKSLIKIYCVCVVKMFVIIFGLCLFIVPGIIYFLQFCFTPFIVFEEPSLDAKGILMLSKEFSSGFKLEIFANLMMAIFVLCFVFCVTFLIVFIFDIFIAIPYLFYLIFPIFALVLSGFLFAIPYIEISTADVYLQAKQVKVTRKI